MTTDQAGAAGAGTPGLATLRLWQLISPALPVGAYAYSEGLEYAVHAGWVCDEAQAEAWIGGQLSSTLAALDLPVLFRLLDAWGAEDVERVGYWNGFLLAARESAELRASDAQLGRALIRLLGALEVADVARAPRECAFATAFALAGRAWAVPVPEAAAGYLWAWAENQVAAAIKLVPLGQTAGQRLMGTLAGLIPAAVERAGSVDDDDVGAVAPALGIASARHETQYSRLFRS